jgi:aspartate carbamoyltransferase regulatory subunit
MEDIMINRTVSVSAIENGTVIDHVRAGQALRIMRLLHVLENKNKVTLGLNLPSQCLKFKDLIKIENRVLNHEEASEISIFAPEVTINIIKNFTVIEKIKPHLPSSVLQVFICPNPACITHHEPIDSFFSIQEQGKQVKLTCHYCEKVFDRDQVKVKI